VNRYILIRRLRVPAVLLLIGVLALLDQMGVINHFWHLFWPLLFILIGVIMLAERAVLTIDSGNAPPYPGAPYAGAPYPGASAAPAPAPESSIVPMHSHDFDNDPNGGHS
jgi:hypothetical protein